jgi:VWFA-related protein
VYSIIVLPTQRRLRRAAGRTTVISATAVAIVAVTLGLRAQQPGSTGSSSQDDPFRFKTAVDVVNVAATVLDSSGRFVPDLQQDDFSVFEDGLAKEISYFSAERVPVSLGIVLDTSGSMAGEKMRSARLALDRFLFDLLDENDEVFLLRFSDTPSLLQGWTTDRALVSRTLGRIAPNGGTALYDAVAQAVPLAKAGSRRKKALLVVSDGNDTTSRTDLRDLRRIIRESEILVYAIGIDGESYDPYQRPVPPPPPRMPLPFPPRPFSPLPGRGSFPEVLHQARPQIGPRGQPWPPFRRRMGDEHVNAIGLREMTNDSGGRTEIIRDSQDLDRATAGIADELSRQYFLAYPAATTRDGQWHSIRVEVKNRSYRVRARRGYIAN